MAGGKRDRMGFDPMEPDFGLVIRNLTESDTTVMVSSAADPAATPDTSVLFITRSLRHFIYS